jgi:cytochrome c oxidase subunit 3
VSSVTTSQRQTRPEISGPVMGMVLFVASEAMFFAAFFGGYFTIKANEPVWPPPGIPHLKIDIATALTVILIVSSVCVQMAVRSTRRGASSRATVWLGVTIFLGLSFLALQLFDYSQLGFGLKDGPFGTLFYMMTGIHMAHVVGGVVFLALVFGQATRGRLTQEHHDPLAAGAIYWDFVDVVWICLFTVFYLLTPR